MKTQVIACLCAAMTMAFGAFAAETTVLYNDQTIAIGETLPSPTDLWVTSDDMTRINGFVLKSGEACLKDLCIPIDQSDNSNVYVQQEGKAWINLTQLAKQIQQPYVQDADASVWSFGPLPLTRQAFLDTAIAPDFALKDRTGKTVHLTDFRGKKVMIVTWASW